MALPGSGAQNVDKFRVGHINKAVAIEQDATKTILGTVKSVSVQISEQRVTIFDNSRIMEKVIDKVIQDEIQFTFTISEWTDANLRLLNGVEFDGNGRMDLGGQGDPDPFTLEFFHENVNGDNDVWAFGIYKFQPHLARTINLSPGQSNEFLLEVTGTALRDKAGDYGATARPDGTIPTWYIDKSPEADTSGYGES